MYLALIGFALDAVLLRQVGSVVFTALSTGSVGDGEVGAHLGAATGGLDSNASGTRSTGHHDDLALEAEEVMEGVCFGDFDRHVGVSELM